MDTFFIHNIKFLENKDLEISFEETTKDAIYVTTAGEIYEPELQTKISLQIDSNIDSNRELLNDYEFSFIIKDYEKRNLEIINKLFTNPRGWIPVLSMSNATTKVLTTPIKIIEKVRITGKSGAWRITMRNESPTREILLNYLTGQKYRGVGYDIVGKTLKVY